MNINKDTLLIFIKNTLREIDLFDLFSLGCPSDEYDHEAPDLAYLLVESKDESEFLNKTHDFYKNHFSEDTPLSDKMRELVRIIYSKKPDLMRTYNQANPFSSPVTRRPGGWKIYPKDTALKMIDEYRNAGTILLGIDAFLLGNDIFHPSFPKELYSPSAIQPSTEHSVDFTARDTKAQDRYESAIKLIKSCDDRYYFEIVCG